MVDNNIDLVLCQDPYIVNGSALMDGCNWPAYYSNSFNSAIFITNTDYVTISNVAFDNSVAISLNVSDNILYIVSQYSSPSSDIDAHFTDLNNHFMNYDNVLIAGDFNVPLLEFGYSRQTDRSEIFLEHLISKNIKIINDPDAPHTFVHGALKGRPDLTLAGVDICENIVSWYVDDRTFSFSDHKYIRFNLNYSPIQKKNIRYKTKNKDFKKFNTEARNKEKNLLEKLLKINNTEELDKHVADLMKYITELADNNFRKGHMSYKPTFKWYTDSLKAERNRVAASYKRSIRNPENEEYRQTYITYRNIYKKKVRKAKRDSWTKYCSRTEEAYGSLFKYISGKMTKPTDFIFTRLNESENFDSYNEVARSLMRAHFDVENVPGNLHNFNSMTQVENYDKVEEVTSREINFAIRMQDNNKAPGDDKLDALIIKNFCRSCNNYVKKLFTRCFKFGHFPSTWKKGTVIFFKKRNKDGLSARSYRPITLLSIFGKLLERIIKIRIMPQLEKLGFLDHAQYGFREKKSTVTAMLALKNLIRNNLNMYKYVALTSIDIQAAFDAVAWRVLARIIDTLPIPRYLKNILKNYISERRVGFSYTFGVVWNVLYKGCPQGSCLGPLLWLIVADYLIKKFKMSYDEIISYADDFVVLAFADTREQLENSMNERVNLFADICEELELSISREKCVSMLFGRYLLERRHPIFKIRNTKIPVKDVIDYLGFRIDSKLNWIDHFENKREKIRSFTSTMKKTSKRDTGLPTIYKKIWYNTVIEKQITYGSEVWFPKLHSHAERKLRSCQRLGLLSILSTYKTVSTEALCVITGIVPIMTKLKYETLKYNVINNNGHIEIEGKKIDSENIMKDLGTLDFPDYNKVNNLFFTEKEDSYYIKNRSLIAYTDGSKMNDGVGAAYTIKRGNSTIHELKITMNRLNSVYQAELTAIKSVIRWFATYQESSIIIYTDSKSSYLVLQRTFPSNMIIKEIFQLLINNTNKKITIGWIKAHAGNPGNERADELAKLAISENNSDTTEEVPFPISIVKRFCKLKEIEEWQDIWNNSPDGRDTYNIIKKVSTDFTCKNQVVQYFITAHGSFPIFLKKIGKRQNNLCECGKVGDIVHYLFGRCPLSPHYFNFDNSRSIRHNLRRVLFDNSNYRKICDIYNVLNRHYSFIRYQF